MTVIGKKERGGEGYGDDVPTKTSRHGHNNSPHVPEGAVTEEGGGAVIHNQCQSVKNGLRCTGSYPDKPDMDGEKACSQCGRKKQTTMFQGVRE